MSDVGRYFVNFAKSGTISHVSDPEAIGIVVELKPNGTRDFVQVFSVLFEVFSFVVSL